MHERSTYVYGDERSTYVYGDEQRESVLPMPHQLNCHRWALNLHRCMLMITFLWKFSTHLWRLSMHECCTYVYGDEQRASVLPISHKNELT